MSDFYWELVLKDGTKFDVSPPSVATVNKRLTNREPINFKTATVLYADVQHFRQTSKVYGQPLLEAAAQAFNEPVMEGDTMVCRWVKKDVTPREWAATYSKNPSYHRLDTQDSAVTVAFLKPIHDIDIRLTDYCTEDEVNRLTQT